MRRRAGFTLMELIVAMMITSVVALLAYGSMQAGLDSSRRLDTYRREGESVALMRSLLTDALRHPADAPPEDVAVFEILRGSGSDALRFVSRGITGPLGSGERWRVVLQPSSSGLQFSATSVDGDSAPIAGEAHGIKSISVRALGTAAESEWQDAWESTRQFPRAVEIAFSDSLGAALGPPLIVATGLSSR